MAGDTSFLQLRKTARIAGLWYLIMAIIGSFCIIYIPNQISVPGNPEATISNIIAKQALYRIGIVSSIISLVPFIITALYLYRLLKDVNLKYAQVMVAIVLICLPVSIVLELNEIAVLVLLSGAGYLSAFTQAQIHAMATFFLNLDKQGYYIGEIFSGLWLFPLGMLSYKSKFIPKILGALLLLNGLSYMVDSFTALLNPAILEATRKFTMLPMMLGELLMIIWLLTAGIKIPKEQKK